jgi:hypothetical protein
MPIVKIPKWFTANLPAELLETSLFKFKIACQNGPTIEVDMRPDLDVDYNDVISQLEETPSIFAYWAAMYSEMKMRVALTEREVKRHRAKLIATALEQAKAADVKISVKQVEAIVEGDPRLSQLETKLALFEKHTGKMYLMIEAIRMKSENLRSLSGFVKIEMGQSK